MTLRDLSSMSFVHPWWLLLLLLLPVIALFEGGKGAAPAVIYSSLKPVLALGKIRRSRIGGWLTSLLLFALAVLIVALARPRLGKHFSQVKASGIDIHARHGRLRFDAGRGLQYRGPAHQPGGHCQDGHAEVHRRAAQRSDRDAGLCRAALSHQPRSR